MSLLLFTFTVLEKFRAFKTGQSCIYNKKPAQGAVNSCIKIQRNLQKLTSYYAIYEQPHIDCRLIFQWLSKWFLKSIIKFKLLGAIYHISIQRWSSLKKGEKKNVRRYQKLLWLWMESSMIAIKRDNPIKFPSPLKTLIFC